MRVFFIKHLRGKGNIGEIKEVPDGYAMNFLIANGYAVKATEDVVNRHNREVSLKKTAEQNEKEEIIQIFDQIKNKKLTLQVTSKDLSGKLYKAISISEIVSLVRKELHIFLKQEWFSHYKPLKEIGEHSVELNFKELKTQFILVII